MKDALTEAKLQERSFHAKYEPHVDFHEIDIKNAQRNPARYQRPLSVADVDSMTETVRQRRHEDDRPLPAPVICKILAPGLYRYSLGEGSGVHRISAYQKAGVTWCDAYVVTEPDEGRRRLLPILLNSWHGLKADSQDRYRAIYDEVKRGEGANAAALCKVFSVPKKGYDRFAKIERTFEILGRQSHISRARFTQDQILELGKLPSAEVMRAAAEFVLAHKAPLDILKQLVRDVENCPSQAGWLGVVDRYRARMPQVVATDPHARTRPEPEMFWDSFEREHRRYQRLKLGVLDCNPKRDVLKACDTYLNMFKMLKGEVLRRERVRKSA